MERLTPMKAIRAKCMDCCCDQLREILYCPIIHCPLWRYRKGREERDELYVRKPMSEKQRIAVEKLRKINKKEDKQ